MAYKVIIQSPDWGELPIEILTREEFFKLDYDNKRIYLNYSFVKETNDQEYTLAVYDFFREVLNANDPGDLGFPEIMGEFIQAKFPEIYEMYSKKTLEERHDAFSSHIASDPEISDDFDVYFADEMYRSDFFYEALIEYCNSTN